MFLTTDSDMACHLALASGWEEGPIMANVQHRDGDGGESRTESAGRSCPPAPDVTEAIAGALGERFAAMSPEGRARLAYQVQRLLRCVDGPEVRRALHPRRDRVRSVELAIVGMGMGVAATALATSPLFT
jgi:hypothetical protein